jgi:MFS family permease
MSSPVDANSPFSKALELGHSSSSSKEELNKEVMNSTRNDSHDAVSPPTFNPGWRFYIAFSAVSALTLMVALDATSLGNALPASPIFLASIRLEYLKLIRTLQVMAQLLHGTAIEAFWSGTSYLLSSTVIQPVIGSFSHIFGRKPLVLLSIFFFAIGIIVASVAHNFTIIILARVIQGLGGGGIVTMTEIVATDMVPLRVRGKYFSFISSMWALGSVVGPILGTS